MCSILGIFEIAAGVDLQALREQALSQSARQRHRGPDWSGVHVDDRAVLVHERLAIVDVSSGAQPLRSADDGERSEEHTSELQSHHELVCRLLLEKKAKCTAGEAPHTAQRQLRKRARV